MLCDHCKKNEATIHIKEIHDGKCVSLNLCAQCAASKEEKGELGAFGLNLADALFHIGAITQKLQQQNAAHAGAQKSGASDPESAAKSTIPEGPVCPVCGWTPEKIREANGKLGCPECYRTFADMINNAVDHFQRGKTHLGKHPASHPGHAEGALHAELQRLRRELQNCVRKEDYEQAAVCRDRIKEIQARLDEK